MLIKVYVKTKSKAAKIEPVDSNLYRAQLKSLPIENKANVELIGLVADYFKVNRSRVILKSGQKSKIKLLEIDI